VEFKNALKYACDKFTGLIPFTTKCWDIIFPLPCHSYGTTKFKISALCLQNGERPL
jgi:hypothetical protein